MLSSARRSASSLFPCALLALALQAAPVRADTQGAAPDRGLVAELTHVQQINTRRRLLNFQLAKQRMELARSTQRATLLQTQLDDPKHAIEVAPVERAKLLDQAADALQMVSYLTRQLQAGAGELVELEQELTSLLTAADADAARAAADTSAPRARMAMLKTKQRALMLRTRAQLGPSERAAQKQAQLAAEAEAWKAQGRDATAHAAKLDAEPRFALLTATPPRGLKQAPAAKGAKVETLRACSVREVDWKNISFGVADRSVQLIDGEGPVVPRSPALRVDVSLTDVAFGDTNGNGREEAFLLVDREEISTSFGGETVQKRGGLYVLESAPDCSMRQLAELVLVADGTGGKIVPGGYEYEGLSNIREYRWVDGVLTETAVRSRIARIIR